MQVSYSPKTNTLTGTLLYKATRTHALACASVPVAAPVLNESRSFQSEPASMPPPVKVDVAGELRERPVI